MSLARFAIYFVPPSASPLGAFGAAVLAYDGDRGIETGRLPLQGIEAGEAAERTAQPARYGFHATLKAPFRLQSSRSIEELYRTVDSFAASRVPVAIGPLSVRPLGAFLALQPAGKCSALDDLAADCVRAFDEFRTPMNERERERRVQGGLSARQTELLDRWGYPYVLDEFRFHMTLAGPLPATRRDAWRSALISVFGKLSREPVTVDSIAVVRQEDAASRFRVVHRAPFPGA